MRIVIDLSPILIANLPIILSNWTRTLDIIEGSATASLEHAVQEFLDDVTGELNVTTTQLDTAITNATKDIPTMLNRQSPSNRPSTSMHNTALASNAVGKLNFDELIAATARNKNTVGSAVTVIQKLVDALVANQDNPAELKSIISDLDKSTDALFEAIRNNDDDPTNDTSVVVPEPVPPVEPPSEPV